jgi:hypothetical protein
MPADNTPNTPAQGTGALSLDEAADILSKPLPPAPRTRQPADTRSASQPEDDDEQPLPDGATQDADTDLDQDGRTDADPDAEPPPEDGDTEQHAEPSYRVVIDGKESAIPVSELVKGYQRNAVFTQRSQSLATERRDFDSERTAVREERGQYARLLGALQAQLEGSGEVEPDWGQLEARDPVEFAVQSARWAQKRRKLAAIEAEQERLNGEARKEAAEALRAHAIEQHRLLLERVPEYKDAAVRMKDRDAIKSFAQSTYGFAEAEIDQLIDHRAIMVLRDARAFRKLQGQRGVVEKRVIETNAPLPRNRGPVVPGASASTVKFASDRLNRTGKLQDAVALELARSRARRADGNGSGNR